MADGQTAALADTTSALPLDALATDAALQTDAHTLLDYTQTLVTGEELMFAMDVPSVPAQDTPIVLAQAAAPSSTALQPDYILKDCQETENPGNPKSADRAVDPAYMLKNFLYSNSNGKVIADLNSIKTTLLEGTKHGKIVSGTSNYGRTAYGYDPIPEYTGDDSAVFIADFQGIHYKIIVDIKVVPVANDNSPQCPAEPTLIKVNGKPISGAMDFGPGYSLDSISVTFANLLGGAVGQTVGTNITLDDNAAGNGWFIDTTPADNSEYLPTSNPNEWVAKAGSDAAGKMDILSVLLHEYGHALGIEHSADSGALAMNADGTLHLLGLDNP